MLLSNTILISASTNFIIFGNQKKNLGSVSKILLLIHQTAAIEN